MKILVIEDDPTVGQFVAYWAYLLTVLGAYVFWPVSKPPRITRVESSEGEAAAAKEHLIATT